MAAQGKETCAEKRKTFRPLFKAIMSQTFHKSSLNYPVMRCISLNFTDLALKHCLTVPCGYERRTCPCVLSFFVDMSNKICSHYKTSMVVLLIYSLKNIYLISTLDNIIQAQGFVTNVRLTIHTNP